MIEEAGLYMAMAILNFDVATQFSIVTFLMLRCKTSISTLLCITGQKKSIALPFLTTDGFEARRGPTSQQAGPHRF